MISVRIICTKSPLFNLMLLLKCWSIADCLVFRGCMILSSQCWPWADDVIRTPQGAAPIFLTDRPLKNTFRTHERNVRTILGKSHSYSQGNTVMFTFNVTLPRIAPQSQSHPLTPSQRCRWVGYLNWKPKQNSTTPLGWISHPPSPQQVNSTVELDTTLKCTPLHQSQRHRWVGLHTPFPQRQWCTELENACITSLTPWMHELYFLNSTQQYTTVHKTYHKHKFHNFSNNPKKLNKMHYFSYWFSISRTCTRSGQNHFYNFLCTDLHKHKLLQTNKFKKKNFQT